MAELFSLQIFRNAFYMSLILSVLFALISFFVVMRRMAFLGAGISHTAFGGVALGILIGWDPFFTSLIFSIITALTIGRLAQRGSFSLDTGIGIFFAFSMALGALFLSMKKEYTFDLTGYLFGNILAVTFAETGYALLLLILFSVIVFLLWPQLLFFSFDPEVAQVSGVRTNLLNDFLMAALALIIVTSIKSVGIILVSALIVLPASFGLIITKKYQWVILSGVLFTLIIMLSGLFLSHAIDIPTGASIVTLGTLLYFGALIIATIKKK